MFGLSIRTLLMGLFGIMVAIVIGLGVFALDKITAVNASTLDIATSWMPSVAAVRELEYKAGRVRIGEGGTSCRPSRPPWTPSTRKSTSTTPKSRSSVAPMSR